MRLGRRPLGPHGGRRSEHPPRVGRLGASAMGRRPWRPHPRRRRRPLARGAGGAPQAWLGQRDRPRRGPRSDALGGEHDAQEHEPRRGRLRGCAGRSCQRLLAPSSAGAAARARALRGGAQGRVLPGLVALRAGLVPHGLPGDGSRIAKRRRPEHAAGAVAAQAGVGARCVRRRPGGRPRRHRQRGGGEGRLEAGLLHARGLHPHARRGGGPEARRGAPRRGAAARRHERAAARAPPHGARRAKQPADDHPARRRPVGAASCAAPLRPIGRSPRALPPPRRGAPRPEAREPGCGCGR
mmetsp:Transcript_60774/g.170315  ORF Transcript_60774/g.170315 Transcript_60774/m.170315 type:complete len:297 (+) Transcript_60774:183-1073(+)